MWHTGSNQPISLEEILHITKEYTQDGGRVYLGTDSFLRKNKCIFATALCLYNPLDSRGGRYFFKKVIVPKEKFSTLLQRMTREVERSLELAKILYHKHDIKDLEIHADVSPPNTQAQTAKLSDMLKGYVQGSGFDCKIKPYAWASASIADRHSK